MARHASPGRCRVEELLKALSAADLTVALERAERTDRLLVLHATGLQASARTRGALVKSRLGTLDDERAHEVVASLAAASLAALARGLPGEPSQDLAGDLWRAAEALAERWTPMLLALALEMLWHEGELTEAERDRLIERVRGGPPQTVPPPRPARAEAVTGALPLGLDTVLRWAAGVEAPPARPDPDVVAAALEELLRLDPARMSVWGLYGEVMARVGRHPDEALRPDPAWHALADLRDRVRAAAAARDLDAVRTIVAGEGAAVRQLLRGGHGAAIAAAVLESALDDARGFGRLLGVVATPFAGWGLFVAATCERAERLFDAGRAGEGELVLRALEEALLRWVRAPGAADADALDRAIGAVLLLRAESRRRHGDFVGARRVLGGLDPAVLHEAHRARHASELALATAEIAGLDRLELPADEGLWRRLTQRLERAATHLEAALAADPKNLVAVTLAGLLARARGDDERAAPLLAQAALELSTTDETAMLAAGLRYHRAVAELRLLDPGSDETAFAELSGALASGYAPPPSALRAAAEGLDAHDSPLLGPFLVAAAEALGAGAVRRDLAALVVARASRADASAAQAAESLGADERAAFGTRFDLLEAALRAADQTGDLEAVERVAGLLDELLARAASPALEARFLDQLAANETLRRALDPAHADLHRVEVLARLGRREEARVVARSLFHRAAAASLPGVDARDLLQRLAELGEDDVVLADLSRAVGAGEDGAGEEGASALARVHVLFVGGDETQARYDAQIEAQLIERYGGAVTVEWHHSGWGSNWDEVAVRVEAAYGRSDVVVLMSFVRTQLGRRVRRGAGDAGLPWVACTGHGREALEHAIARAVELVVRARAQARLDDDR
jgi:hypothetical protein